MPRHTNTEQSNAAAKTMYTDWTAVVVYIQTIILFKISYKFQYELSE